MALATVSPRLILTIIFGKRYRCLPPTSQYPRSNASSRAWQRNILVRVTTFCEKTVAILQMTSANDSASAAFLVGSIVLHVLGLSSIACCKCLKVSKKNYSPRTCRELGLELTALAGVLPEGERRKPRERDGSLQPATSDHLTALLST